MRSGRPLRQQSRKNYCETAAGSDSDSDGERASERECAEPSNDEHRVIDLLRDSDSESDSAGSQAESDGSEDSECSTASSWCSE